MGAAGPDEEAQPRHAEVVAGPATAAPRLSLLNISCFSEFSNHYSTDHFSTTRLCCATLMKKGEAEVEGTPIDGRRWTRSDESRRGGNFRDSTHPHRTGKHSTEEAKEEKKKDLEGFRETRNKISQWINNSSSLQLLTTQNETRREKKNKLRSDKDGG